MAHLTRDHASPDRWVCVYPAYLDGNLTLPDGRRIPKDLVSVPQSFSFVCEDLRCCSPHTHPLSCSKCPEAPSLQEIATVLDSKKCSLQWRIEV